MRPRVCNYPPSATSLGTEACEFATSIGLVPDPWQRDVLEVFLGVRPDGKWSAFEAGLLVARQNGKGGVLEMVELAALYLFGERLILHSAHQFKTAQEAFLRVKGLVDNFDDLSKRVARMRTAHGEEGIDLKSGARLRFVARSRSSGRGFSGDRVILDEAQELPRSAMGALLPTLSARPNPQVVYTGTVPSPENESEHWESVRDRGRRGDDSGLAWIEYSPELSDDYDMDDPKVWAASNPALGIRINGETVSRERNSLGDAEFARERLSIWDSRSAPAVITPSVWRDLVDVKSQVVDPVAFAVEVSPDSAWASIGIAGRRRDGVPHVEVIDNRRGTGWVTERLDELVARWRPCAVAVNPSGPAGALLSGLNADVTLVGARELAQACGEFYVAATETGLKHRDQPLLNVSVANAKKRKAGDAWVWHPLASGVDISPLWAVTLALHGFLSNRAPVRSGKAVFI